ncbi:MAG: hypothetical protein ACOYLO_06775 [Ferruginibacter sp.]
MNISNFIKIALFTITVWLLCTNYTTAQPCTETADLVKMPGKFFDHNWTATGGHVSSYTSAERNIAVKTMDGLEAIFKKKYFGDGSNGKGSFGYGSGDYFGPQFFGTYEYNIGFYQFFCDNGKTATQHEFGTSIDIAANKLIYPALHVPNELSFAEAKFYSGGNRKDRNRLIPLFTYITFQSPDEEEKIMNGSGYSESKEMYSDAYDQTPSIYRTWYITPPNKKILIPVIRKEYLESLLQYYEIEKEVLQRERLRIIKTDKETLKTYEKEKNGKHKKDYDYFLTSITENEIRLAHIIKGYETKKATVAGLLQSKPQSWLSAPAVINPALSLNNYCATLNEYNKSGYFTFSDFFNEESGRIVYKWNPDLFKQLSLCAPVFFRVQVRYKKNVEFSMAIRDFYTENLDFEAMRKLLVNHQ